MMDGSEPLDQRIGSRVRALRAAAQLSLEALAERSGVRRSMLSLIERGEASPSAVVLDKVATSLGLTLSSLLEAAGKRSSRAVGPLARAASQPLWEDPASGYTRRNVTPRGSAQPMRIVEVRFPAGARIAFDNDGKNASTCQQVWILEGSMQLTVGKTRYQLQKGDCLAMTLDQPVIFHNAARKSARYVVVIAGGALS